jgi:hypothetical protein
MVNTMMKRNSLFMAAYSPNETTHPPVPSHW